MLYINYFLPDRDNHFRVYITILYEIFDNNITVNGTACFESEQYVLTINNIIVKNTYMRMYAPCNTTTRSCKFNIGDFQDVTAR